MCIDDIQGIDEIDKKILDTIEHDARMSYSDIAQVVGLTRVAVKNRMDSLINRGIIKEFQTVINPKGDPNGVKFIIDIEAFPDTLEDIVSVLALFKFNREIYTASGDSRIHVVGYAPNYATYKSYVEQVFKKVKGAKKMICSQMLVTHKDVDGGVEYVRKSEEQKIQ